MKIDPPKLGTCRKCGRPLRDPVSVARMIGRVCEGKLPKRVKVGTKARQAPVPDAQQGRFEL